MRRKEGDPEMTARGDCGGIEEINTCGLSPVSEDGFLPRTPRKKGLNVAGGIRGRWA